MSVRKLPSGNYQIREQRNNVSFSVTLDHKPTQKELRQLIDEKEQAYLKKHGRATNLTFKEAAEAYNESKSNILSPSTITGYKSCLKRYSDDFLNTEIHELTTEQIQAEINRIAGFCTPKTTRNMNGYISSVLKMHLPDSHFNISLPPKQKKDVFIPDAQILKAILNECRNTRYYVPIRLGCYGLRRSEICALTLDDLEGNIITINKAMVQDSEKGYIIRPFTKTYGSTRKIVIDDELRDRIIEQGCIYDGYIDKISQYLTSIQEQLGLPHFTLHKLRHYFASSMSGIVSEADLLQMGGWQTDYVMKKIYRHSMETDNLQAQEKVANKMSNLLD